MDLIKKITTKSKQLIFKASREYKPNGNSSMPYAELIVINEDYPDNVFLVHENMIFGRNSIADTSYTVYSFDREGEFKKEENVEDLGRDFFAKMQIVHKID